MNKDKPNLQHLAAQYLEKTRPLFEGVNLEPVNDLFDFSDVEKTLLDHAVSQKFNAPCTSTGRFLETPAPDLHYLKSLTRYRRFFGENNQPKSSLDITILRDQSRWTIVTDNDATGKNASFEEAHRLLLSRYTAFPPETVINIMFTSFILGQEILLTVSGRACEQYLILKPMRLERQPYDASKSRCFTADWTYVELGTETPPKKLSYVEITAIVASRTGELRLGVPDFLRKAYMSQTSITVPAKNGHLEALLVPPDLHADDTKFVCQNCANMYVYSDAKLDFEKYLMSSPDDPVRFCGDGCKDAYARHLKQGGQDKVVLREKTTPGVEVDQPTVVEVK